MLKINGRDYSTSKPTDLDAALIAATGCGAAEIDTVLAAGPERAARALAPFLSGDVSLGDLARAIAADPTAMDGIRKLYADQPAAPGKKADAGKGEG